MVSYSIQLVNYLLNQQPKVLIEWTNGVKPYCAKTSKTLISKAIESKIK